jgi:hypothetical protein
MDGFIDIWIHEYMHGYIDIDKKINRKTDMDGCQDGWVNFTSEKTKIRLK